MRKVIAAINMTLDGVCDHTVGIVDENLHQHYSDLVNNAGVMLYGRTTYQLMQFWQTLLTNPSDKKSMNDFAFSINKIEKIVFSSTLTDTGWVRWSRKSGHKIKPKFVSFYGKEKQKASTEV